MSSRDNSSKTLQGGNQGESLSDKAGPKSYGREFDHETAAELVEFFLLLDKWDREKKEESEHEGSEEESEGSSKTDAKNNGVKLGSNLGQFGSENRVKPGY